MIATLGYLATQVRHSRLATADQNRLVRATGIREMMLTAVNNDDLRLDLVKTYGTEDHYLREAEQLGLSVVAASRVDWTNASWAWLHWGQYAGIKSNRDLEELAHLVDTFYRIPGMRRSWDTSPWIKPIMDPQFVAFVDDILANGVRNDG